MECPQNPQEGIRSLGIEVIDFCELRSEHRPSTRAVNEPHTYRAPGCLTGPLDLPFYFLCVSVFCMHERLYITSSAQRLHLFQEMKLQMVVRYHVGAGN